MKDFLIKTCLKCETLLKESKVSFKNNTLHLWQYCPNCGIGKAINKDLCLDFDKLPAISLEELKQTFKKVNKIKKEILYTNRFKGKNINPHQEQLKQLFLSTEEYLNFRNKVAANYKIDKLKKRSRRGLPKKTIFKQTPEIVKDYAKQHQEALYPSEQWFIQLFQKTIDSSLAKKVRRNKSNQPLGRFIPDLVNTYMGYIIEVDGENHNNEKQQQKDKQKDRYYQNLGFKVFRVKAYDLDSFLKFRKDFIEFMIQRLWDRKLRPKFIKNFYLTHFNVDGFIYEDIDYAQIHEDILRSMGRIS